MRKIFHFIQSLFRVGISSSSRAKPSLPEKLCRQFSLREIRSATCDFDDKLIIGRGGQGTVYKGLIDKRSLFVAVKVLSQRSWGEGGYEDFQNEVLMLCQLKHQHLVSLIGFCVEKDKLILVYNYMSNGSLHDYLHGDNVPAHEALSWKQRLEICIGAARGLHYLHTGAKRAVIHRDIKSKNILLDGQLVPKISDFGLSKIGPNFSHSNAPIQIELTDSHPDCDLKSTLGGTFGYMDPELFINPNQVTDKSDVYSFGVVLFEVLCGRKAVKRNVKDVEEEFLTLWVRKWIRNCSIYNTIDPYLKGKIAPTCLETFLKIAFSCIQRKGSRRPAIGEVQETLELALELQCKADAEILESINHYGESGMYEEAIFSPSAFDDTTNWAYEYDLDLDASFTSLDSFSTNVDSTSGFGVTVNTNTVEPHGSFSFSFRGEYIDYHQN